MVRVLAGLSMGITFTIIAQYLGPQQPWYVVAAWSYLGCCVGTALHSVEQL